MGEEGQLAVEVVRRGFDGWGRGRLPESRGPWELEAGTVGESRWSGEGEACGAGGGACGWVRVEKEGPVGQEAGPVVGLGWRRRGLWG